MTKQTIYPETFNARYMTFEDVASSFIQSSHFTNILKNGNTILTGSRGCGKTTLLKMLHPKALYNWQGYEADKVRAEIPFIGIYIPTDRQWSSQFEVLNSNHLKNSVFVNNIFNGVVNANVLVAVCSTFSALIEILKLNDKFEIELSISLIENWKISKPITPSLSAITLKLLSMVNEFNIYLQKKAFDSDLPDVCFSDFVNLVSIAIVSFENLVKELNLDFFNKDYKWALCFDELEIAPKWLYDKLISQDLRSRDQKILFKLTSTPGLDELKSKTNRMNPEEFDDFKIQKLWVYDKKSQAEWRKFCKDYLVRYLRKTFNRSIDPITLFGLHNDNDSLRTVESHLFAKSKWSDNDSEFEENGVMWRVMILLQDFDKSFYRYLIRKDIVPQNPVPINPNQISSVHRKIKPIVLYRYYFTEMSKFGEKIKLRSRNVNSFNHGMDYIFDIADGNPRAFVNLISAFNNSIHFGKDKNAIRIKINDQARIIEDFSNNYFYPRIENYPKNLIRFNNRNIALIEIINCIGEYFFERLVLDDFRADPVIFFYIDRECPSEFKTFIDIALEAGAILKIEDEITTRRSNVNIYRLTYSLYPKYRLPQRDYNPIGLSVILKSLIEKNKDSDSQILIEFKDED